MAKIAVLVSNPYLPDPRVHKEVRTLARHSHKIFIVARNSRPLSPVDEDRDGIGIHRITLKIPENLTLFNQLSYYRKYVWLSYKKAKKEGLDIIHCHDIYTLPIGILLKLRMRKPLIYDSHEFYPGLHFPQGGFKAKVLDWMERIMLPFTDEIITVSPELAKRYGKKVTTIMNVPEILEEAATTDKTVARDKYGIDKDAFLLIYQGGLMNKRNLELIVTKLATGGAARIPGLVILVCGTGHLEKKLRKMAADNVVFTGHLATEELFSLTSASDLGLILFEETPNNRLGLPNKLFEFMMSGLPILASDLPVMAKIVKKEGVGMIVRPGNLKETIAAIEKLAGDDALRREMGKRGRHISKTKYNWEAQSVLLTELYEKISKRLK